MRGDLFIVNKKWIYCSLNCIQHTYSQYKTVLALTKLKSFPNLFITIVTAIMYYGEMMKLKEDRPLYRLAEVAEILRSENGCAWDKKQTWDSLKTCLIEETYEVYEAIENNDPTHLKEELGDYLYQAFAHAQIAKEQNPNLKKSQVQQ